ncbi:MAG: hypothetical protein JSV33_14525 [bacterium]|nr:MAG: hypothetical protein JSV33_14525 [bacterium]
MGKRTCLFALILIVVLAGCKVIDNIRKDIPIHDMDSLKDHYSGRTAWTRSLLIDSKGGGIIDRDTKVMIVGLDMHWSGAVTVKGPGRKRIRHHLNLERPITKEIFEEKMGRLFWFKKPEYRYRMNLRRYGKKTAKAIFNHEIFKGMKRQAALESWGYPDEMKSTELGGVLEEQWIFKDPRQQTKKRYVWLRDGLVDKYEE